MINHCTEYCLPEKISLFKLSGEAPKTSPHKNPKCGSNGIRIDGEVSCVDVLAHQFLEC